MLCSKGRDYEHAKLRSMSQITVMTGPEGHRRWREEERQEIVAAAFAPGESVAEIGRRFDVATSLSHGLARARFGYPRKPVIRKAENRSLACTASARVRLSLDLDLVTIDSQLAFGAYFKWSCGRRHSRRVMISTGLASSGIGACLGRRSCRSRSPT